MHDGFMFATQLWTSTCVAFDDHRDDLLTCSQDRLERCFAIEELMHMVVHPPDDPSQDITPPLVGRDESLRHEESRTSHMISDDSHMFGVFFALTSEGVAREVAISLVT